MALLDPNPVGARHGSAQAEPLQDAEVARVLGSLIQSSPGTGTWVWDLTSNAVHWSSEVYRIFDAPDFDNTIASFRELVVTEDRETNLEVVSRALAQRQTFHTSFRIKTPKGEHRRISNVGRAIYGKNGQPRKIVGLVANITPSFVAVNNIASSVPAFCEFTPNFPAVEAMDSYVASNNPDAIAYKIKSIGQLREHLLFVRAHPQSHAASDTDGWVLAFLLELVDRPTAARKLSAELLKEFNSMADVLNADRARLSTVKGIRNEHMQLLDVTRYAMEIVLHPRTEPLKFDNPETLLRYLRISHAYQTKEQLRVLFLDRANHVLANELMQEGTVDHTPVYTREIIKRALELSASSMVLVHNHPSGDPTPSHIDIELTRQIAKVGAALGIIVKDHVILGRYGQFSLAELGLI